jgi:O-antigen/teichoic acid export membrane protein
MNRMRGFLQRKFVRDTLALQIGKLGTTGLTILSSLLVARLLGTEPYGAWALAQSFFSIWQTLNLTGVSMSANTQLAMAVGAKNTTEILNVSAFYVQISTVWAVFISGALALIGPLLAGMAYSGEVQIGVLAAWLSLTTLPDALYAYVLIALQSHRSMRTLAVLQNLNQLVLLACTAAALLLNPTPEAMVLSRLAYSTLTMGLAFVFFERGRRTGLPYPPLTTIARHALRVSPRPYWRFGLWNAIDKNITGLFVDIPMQLVGIMMGKTAAGYLGIAFRTLTIPSTLTSAVFDNLQAVIPQAVGRGDFGNLRRNLRRVLIGLTVGAVLFYAAFALTAPLFVPLLFGAEWLPAVPAIAALSVYGAVTIVGGTFGPLYRALNVLRPIVLLKTLTLIIVTLSALVILRGTDAPVEAGAGALFGAWLVNVFYLLSVGFTAWVSLRGLQRQIPPA